jgi:ParB-like chromosome segregation protein Spo0J
MDDNDITNIPASLDRRPPKEANKSDDVVEQPVSDAAASKSAEDIDARELQPHPFADMFPRMQGEDFDALVASIREGELEEPIVKYEGKILDGRNRYEACAEAKVEPVFVEYEGTDPLGFVLRKNLHRRHLTASQRAMVAAKMANMKQGERTDIKPSVLLQKVSVAKAAKKFNVSPRSVETAKVVLTSANDELIAAVERGDVTVSAAAKQVTQSATSSKPVATPPTEAEAQKLRLLKLWNKTGKEARALFLEKIGATT